MLDTRREQCYYIEVRTKGNGQMNIQEFITKNNLKMTSEYRDSNPNMDNDNMDHWTCKLRAGRKQLTIPFSMGYGHHGKEPSLAGVLECLASDANVNPDFEDFCSEFGYNTDSRKAEKIHRSCLSIAKRLDKFLPGGVDSLSEVDF